MDAILRKVARRCLIFAGALIVALAPIVLNGCLLVCASIPSSAHVADAAHTHSCHESGPVTGNHLAPRPHLCGHGDEFPAGSSVSSQYTDTQKLMALAVDGPAADTVWLSLTRRASRDTNVLPRPDAELVLPLRI